MAISRTDAVWAEPGDTFIVDMGAGRTSPATFHSYDVGNPDIMVVITEWYPNHPMRFKLEHITIPEQET
jgi:hypothetical protein